MRFVLHLIALIAVSSLAGAVPLAAAETKSAVDVTRTATLPLAPGGTVRIDRTWGDVSVEVWDKPMVEVTVTAASKQAHTQDQAAEARTRLARFGFDAKAISPNEVVVTGVSPSASLLKPFGGKSGVAVHYAIRMPRTSSLVLRHEIGDVTVAGVQADVDVANDTGEVRLELPLGPDVAVETSSKVGDIELNAELRGKGQLRRRALVGHRFSYRPAAPDRQVTVRVGVGSITIS